MPELQIDSKAIEYLSKKDKKLGAFIASVPVPRRELHDDVFEALISSIVSQQVSGAAARTIMGRLRAACEGTGAPSAEEAANPGYPVTPGRICALQTDELRAAGLSGRKAEYISGIADTVMSGGLDLDALAHEPDSVIVERLSALRGIGVWTAEMLLIFAFGRPDVLSWGDLAIRRGITTLYGLKTLSTEQFERYRKRYSPYGTTASVYLWEASHGIGIA